MVVLPPWFALAVVVTVLNGATCGLIAWRERDRTLWLWACAWLSWGLAVIPLSLLDAKHAEPVTAISCGLLWVVSSLCFLGGAYALAQRGMPRAWFGVAGACVVAAFALGVGPHGARGMVPLVLFQSGGLLATGVLILRSVKRGAGRWLCGAALILLALHLLDAPAASERPPLLVWGFALATSLEMMAALGMLMLHYEHARFELIEAQRVLAEKSRVEALGRVARGVAHDFNNMLTIIRGNLTLVRHEAHARNELRESLDAIEEAVSHAARLTAQLLTFGRRSTAAQAAVDVREVVRSTLALLEKVMPEGIRVRYRSVDGNYLCSMERALLEQIVLNLTTNARDAIAERGTISVELDRLDLPQAHVVLRVADDGCGMDATVLERAFEPFFSTKGAGRGTGIGLASVQAAVHELGGEIRMESKPGEGTKVEVVLPMAQAAQPRRVDTERGA